MHLTSDHAFIALGAAAIVAILAFVGLLWWTIRNARVHDQLLLPFTVEEFAEWDDAVRRHAREKLTDE